MGTMPMYSAVVPPHNSSKWLISCWNYNESDGSFGAQGPGSALPGGAAAGLRVSMFTASEK